MNAPQPSVPPRLVGLEVLPPMEPAQQDATAPTRGAKRKASSQGRFECINTFIDVTMCRLTAAQRSVWLVLWRDTKPSGVAQTSQADIARRAGITDRAVRKALSALMTMGLVIVTKRGSLQRGCSIYRVAPVVKLRLYSGAGVPVLPELGFRRSRNRGSYIPQRTRNGVHLLDAMDTKNRKRR
jgi:hypothetical protein